MKQKDKIQARLQEAFNNGFIPKEIRLYMQNNDHIGNVWVVEQPDTIKSDEVGKSKDAFIHDGRRRVGAPIYKDRMVFRIGIGYKVLETGTDEEGNEFEREASHVIVYDQDEIEDILREIK